MSRLGLPSAEDGRQEPRIPSQRPQCMLLQKRTLPFYAGTRIVLLVYSCFPPHYFFLFNSLCFSMAAANSLAKSAVLTWIIQVSSPSPFSFDVVILTYFLSALYDMSGRTARFSAMCPRGSARRSSRTALVSLCFSSRRAPTPCVDHGL